MKKLFLFVLAIVGLASCTENANKGNEPEPFTISINVENANDVMVYLQRYDNEELKTIDSLVLKDTVAVFTVKQSDNVDPYLLKFAGERNPIVVFADNSNATVSGDYQNYREIAVEAAESQAKMEQLYDMLAPMEDDEQIYYTVMGFVKENYENVTGVYALYRYKWAFQIDELTRFVEMLPENMHSAYKTMILNYIKKVQRTMPGNTIIDFTQKDVNGEDFTLSKVLGDSKITIIDFWASWCPDCRKENPGLVKIYNKFKNKGVDIVSVSLDNKEEAWKNAIEKDNLTWKHHVSDLNGWNNSVADMYTIVFIPQNIIVNSEGVILAKNVPMEKMEDFLNNSLK